MNNPVFIREEIIKAIRSFFYARRFHEVITPVFNKQLPLEPNIFAFETSWKKYNTEQPLYLTTSPESALKKTLATGVDRCFSLGKCFRNLEDSSDRHNPEFLMLEWYRKGSNYKQIMQETERLFKYISKTLYQRGKIEHPDVLQYGDMRLDLSKPWPVYSLIDLFKTHCGFDYREYLTLEKISQIAHEKGYVVDHATWEQLFNQLFLNEIETTLGNDPCFIIDFPSTISPLCKPVDSMPEVAERFELYIAGMEMGNGNTENTDVDHVKALFAEEATIRDAHQNINPPIDTMFLSALEKLNTVPYAGIGVGIDRMSMVFANTSTISEVEPMAVR